MSASSSRRPAARCSSTRSANCRPPRRSSSCAPSRKAKSSRSAARKPVKVDVRIVSATNRDLIADVKQGRFREDLFYRLHVFPITVPPLRERPADIPALTRHFLARFAAEEGKRIAHGHAGRAAAPRRLPLAGQYPPAGKCRVPRRGPRRGRQLSASKSFRRSRRRLRRRRRALLRNRPRTRRRNPSVRSMSPSLTRRLCRFRGVRAGSVHARHPRRAAFVRYRGRRQPLEAIGGRHYPVRHYPLPGADVGSRPTAADRPFHALPQARSARP